MVAASTLVILQLLQSAVEPQLRRLSPYLPDNLPLVRATALEVRKTKSPDTHDVAQLRINEVIDGPQDLKGKHFTCMVGNLFHQGSTFKTLVDFAVFQLEKGVEGLWWVYMDPDGTTVRPELRKGPQENVSTLRLKTFPILKMPQAYRGIRNPDIEIREWEKIQNSHYETNISQGELWAKTVVALRKAATDEDRRKMLEEIAGTENSHMAGWAVALLSRGAANVSVPFLTKLASNSKVAPDAQVAVDVKLFETASEQWKESEIRKAMLVRWLADGSKRRELLHAGSNRLRDIIGSNAASGKMIVSVLTSATDRADKLTEDEINNLVTLVSNLRFQPDDRTIGFDFLLKLAKNSSVVKIRGTSAWSLRHFKPLRPSEITEILRARDAELDKSTRNILNGLLD